MMGAVLLLIFACIFSVLGANPCQTCLTFGLWNLGWCGNTSHTGVCLLGWTEPPPTCKSRWNFHFCPEEIPKQVEIFKAPYRNNSTYPACSNIQCTTDRFDRRPIPPSGSANLQYPIDVPNHYIVSEGYVAINASYCCLPQVGERLYQAIDVVFGSHQAKGLVYEISQCKDQPTIVSQISLEDYQFPWWTFIIFNQDNLFGINTYNDSCGLFLNDATLYMKMVDVDPYLNPGPYIIPYDDDEYSLPDDINFYGHNFLKFAYVCKWLDQKKPPFWTDAYLVNTTTQNCDFPELGTLPNATAPVLLEVALLPKEIPKLDPKTTQVWVYYQPSFYSISPTNVSSFQTIFIHGKGFAVHTFQYKVMIGPTVITAVQAFNETTLAFDLPDNHLFVPSSFCVRVLFLMYTQEIDVTADFDCLSLTFGWPPALPVTAVTPTPVPIPVPVPIPEAPVPITPTPAPSPPDPGDEIRAWVKAHPWIWVVVFIVALLLVIIIIFIIAKMRKTCPTNGSDLSDPLLAPPSTLENTSLIIERKDIDLKEMIGQGGFATIYRGYWHGTEVAVKVLKGTASTQSFVQEARLMRRLRHPNIVAFLGLVTEKPDLSIITEYLQKGSLHDLLRRRSIIFEPGHLKQFMIDTCKGMSYLHAHNIIHRDLKCHNLLVDKDWNLKVGDFGLSRAIEDITGVNKMTVCGTPSWAAPEVMRHQDYTLKADVYSFGVCLWEMCTRRLPYAGIAPYQVVISVATQGMRPEMDDSIPKYFADFMEVCWAEDPAKRPTFPDLMITIEQLDLPTPSKRRPYKSPNKVDTSATELEETPIEFSDL